jgi:hypothetical protein
MCRQALAGPQGTLRWVHSGVQMPVRPFEVVHGLPTKDLFQSFLRRVPACESWTELAQTTTATTASKTMLRMFTWLAIVARCSRALCAMDKVAVLAPRGPL